MNKLDTLATRHLVAPECLRVVAEDAGGRCEGRDRVWVRRVLSAIGRWVWPEPLPTESPAPYTEAPPRHWPAGEPFWWGPYC
jgi:hypothetical protein